MKVSKKRTKQKKPVNDMAQTFKWKRKATGHYILHGEYVVEEPEIQSEEMGIDNLPGLPSYPDGPYSLELFDVMPDMQFYNPWVGDWVALSDFFKHEKNKALVIVSSAGWCGPCSGNAGRPCAGIFHAGDWAGSTTRPIATPVSSGRASAQG